MLHHFLSGGEECTNNVGYFAPAGLTCSGSYTALSIVGSPVSSFSKPFFRCSTSAGGGEMRVTAAQADTNFFYGVYFYNPSTPGSGGYPTHLNLLSANGAAQLTLVFNTNGTITLSSGGAVLATSGPVVLSQQLTHVQIGGVIASGAAGSCSVRLNGSQTPVPGLNLSGINTQQGDPTSPTVNAIQFAVADAFPQILARDFYFCDNTGTGADNTFLGQVSCELTMPISNAAVDLAPVGNAANWQNAAMLPPNPSVDYNSSATVGDVDLFNIAPVPSTVANVFGFYNFMYVNQSGSGSRAMQTVTVSGSNVADGTETYLTPGPVLVRDFYRTLPGGGALTPAAYNALQIGQKVAA